MILYLGLNYIYQVNNVIKNILNAQHFLEFQVLKPFGPELLGFGQQNLIYPECLSEGQVYRKIFLLLGF